MAKPELQKPAIPGIHSGARKTIRVSRQEVIRTRELMPGQPMPLVIEPALDGVDLAAWASNNHEMVESLLLRNRALLFRGFAIKDVSQFRETVVATCSGQLLEYVDRSTPRYRVGEGVYISTIYPSDESINLHNEGTYWKTWPLKIYFCCLRPSEIGGETPISDTRGVYRRIDPQVRQSFIDKQVMYLRNYNEGFGLSWQEVFQTSDKAELEENCRKNGIEIEWKSGGRLRTRQVRPAVRLHPETGEPLWFNHAAFFHVSALQPHVSESLLNMFAEEDLPFMTYYGDGSAIEPEVAERIRQAYRDEQITFAWLRGDILLLDNMSVAHGRSPYVGDRQVVVAMAEPYSGEKG